MIAVECLNGSRQGTKVAVTAEKPLVFRIPVPIGDDERVTVEHLDGQAVLTNRSHRKSQLNGREVQRSVLRNDDVFTIGRDQFRVHIAVEEDGTSTQALDLAKVLGDDPARCTACEGAWSAPAGWSDGAGRICQACLAKGVRPGNLARRPEPQPEVVEPAMVDPAPAPAPAAAAADESDSDRLRNVRRISATRLSAVEEAPKAGLFSKVTAVFSGRAGRQQLERLEQERRSLLCEAGRLVLAGLPWGLPDDLPRRLLAGQEVGLRRDDLDRPAYERWRAERERLARLDAEIAAARKALGLGPDPDAVAPAPLLRPQEKALSERAFASMDGLMTEDMGSRSHETTEPAQSDSAARNPGRKRPVRRHR